MEKLKKSQVKYYHYLIFSGVMWGFTPLIYKKSLLITSVFGLLIFKYIFGLIILVINDYKKYVKINKDSWLTLFLFIILGVLLPIFMYTVGLSKTSALHASFISLSFPFFVYIFATIFLKDTIHKKVIIGSLIASVGLLVIILFGSNGGTPQSTSSLSGDLIMLASQFFAAIGIVFSRQLLVKKQVMPPEQLAFFEYLFSALFFTIVAIIFSQNIAFNVESWQSVFWLVLLATIAGSIPLVLYYKAVKHLPAERTPDINFVGPLVGSVVAVIVMKESISVMFILGALLILVGLLLSNNKLHPLIWGAHLKLEENKIIHKVHSIEKTIVNKSKAIYYDFIP